jgi:hypothetical protein
MDSHVKYGQIKFLWHTLTSMFKKSTADWSQEDSSQLNYIKNKPEIATPADALNFIIEEGYIEPLATPDGTVYIDAEDTIYIL